MNHRYFSMYLGLLATRSVGSESCKALVSVGPQVPEGGALAEIVVTAEQRSVDLEKASAAITTASGEDRIDRIIQNIQQAQVIAPSLQLRQDGNSTQAFIRGANVIVLDLQDASETKAAIEAHGTRQTSSKHTVRSDT